jgi:predicted TIM-barrel fold metal-dependent hydrolase
MTYTLGIDVDAVTAIDTHVHVEQGDDGHQPLPKAFIEAATKYFHSEATRPTLTEVAAYYRERNLAAVVFTIDAHTSLGVRPNSIDDIANGAADNNDVLIPFGSVDPHDPGAIDEAHRQREELGVRGFKFHPTVQAFDPSDEKYRPLWSTLEGFGLPVIVHTGQTGIGAGVPGAFGLKLRYSNPMLLDEVAADFPGLTIVMAHPSVPWQDEAIAVATHKANVWIDLSGWSPKYFPEQLVRQANSLLQDRVLFGSDYPLLTPDRWMKDFAALTLKDEVRPKILKNNAVRLLGLSG